MSFVGPPGEPSSIMRVVRRRNSPQPRRQQQQQQQHAIAVPSVYGAYPPPDRQPQAPPPPARVNPLRPQPPERMTCVTETVDTNWINELRLRQLQRQQFHRFHSAWSRYYYGSVPEKELYNRFIREGLKEQMRDRQEEQLKLFKERSLECGQAAERDRVDIESDIVQRSRRRQFLTQFRDANKEMMEAKAMRAREERQQETQRDREKLQLNPINWSCSLK